jgi:hypothetical protein
VQVAAAVIAVVLLAGAYSLTTGGDGHGKKSTVTASPPRRAGCEPGPRNVVGGHDPWGGCFPGPANTGVPDGTELSDYTGSCEITAANTVIDGKRVMCDLDIAAEGVEIRNSEVHGGVYADDPTDAVTVTDSTIDAGPVHTPATEGERGIGSRNFRLLRVEVRGGYSSGMCEYDCEVRDSWLHGQDRDEGGHAHESGIRLGSGTTPRSQRLIHNTIVCDAKEVLPDAGCSADVTGYGDFAPIRNNLVEQNLLGASPEGAFCAYGGSTKEKPFPNGSNNVWRHNIFQRGANGKCATYAPMVDGDWGKRGNLWTGNRWDTGGSVPGE